ncbi:sensor histidine kinase [Cryptosporangium sp. NPDC051539]|uniref:sensor histidine kinase n=1 Tax=Cryptosporangium sp. NPDC051539 TaxID=3363962 RepID=UPI00379716EC
MVRMVRDVALALAVCGLTLAAYFSEKSHWSPDPVAITIVVLTSAAVLIRRPWPLAALAVNVVGIVTFQLRDYPVQPPVLGVLVAVYSVAVTGSRRRSVLTGVGLGVLIVLVVVGTEPEGPIPALVDALVWVAVAFTLGEAVRVHRAYRAEVAERDARAAYAREQAMLRRAAEERVRIARDLHDVLAHSLAQITVQSGVAAHLLAAAPEPDAATLAAVRTSLDGIAEAGGAGMAEVAGILDVLRGDDPALVDGVPAVSRISALVEAVRGPGPEATLEIVGEPVALPPAHEVAAYRIVQESLTNVVRHAGARQVRVVVEYAPDAVRVRVSDDGSGGTAGGSGHGIVGMTERAHSVGGTLRASAGPDGFTVEAVLPVPA